MKSVNEEIYGDSNIKGIIENEQLRLLRKKYKYKYNVRFDMLDSFTEIDRNVKRFYCPPKQYKKIIKKIKEEMIFNV